MIVLIALLIGAASAFAFQPVGLWWLMPLAFAALCHLIETQFSLRRAFLVGWAFSLGQFCVGLNWIATAFTFQAAMPAWLGWIAVALLSVYLAVFPMLAVGLSWRFGRGRPVPLVLALAGGWAICEWLRATIFTGFAWNPVGVTLVDTSLLPAARLIGTYGLSAMMVMLGGLLWLLWLRQLRPVTAIAALLLLLSALPFGALLSTPARAVHIVQPNIGQEKKWSPGFAAEALATLDTLSQRQTSGGPRLLLWPEAAITDPLDDARTGAAPFVIGERRRAVATLGAGDLLLTGGLALNSRTGAQVDGAANSVFVLDASGRSLGRYDKAHLVPYGEYLPMRPLLSAIGLSRLAPGDLDFAAGPGPRTLDLGQFGKAGFQLCYEIIFSGEVVDRAHRPDFIFNPSNDAWFGRWGPPQHLAQARLRAAEEGIPVVRSTPTGISALVDSRGTILRALPWRQAGSIDAILPAATAPTPFARYGNLIPLLFGFALLFVAIALGSGRRYRPI